MSKVLLVSIICFMGFLSINWTSAEDTLTAEEGSLADPCSSGPTFWCASTPNAEECNETEFCQKVCWKPIELNWNLVKLYRRKMNSFPPKHFIQLCFPNRKAHVSPPRVPPTNTFICDECRLVAKKLDELLRDRSMIETITVAMRFFCNLLPVYAIQCRNFVDDLGQLINRLEPYLRDPEKFCAELHVCPSNLYDLNEHTPLLEFLHKYYTSDMNSTFNDNSLCDDCVEAINSARAQFEDPAQQKNIMDTFHEFCSYFGILKKECDDYVDNFVPQLLNAIITYLSDARGVCSRLGFCVSRSAANELEDY